MQRDAFDKFVARHEGVAGAAAGVMRPNGVSSGVNEIAIKCSYIQHLVSARWCGRLKIKIAR